MFLGDHLQVFRNYIYPQTDDDDGEQFTIHRSPINPNTLLIIRICCLVYLSAIFIWEIQLSFSALINIIYLTQWGYFFTWLYFLLVIQHYILYQSQLFNQSSQFYKKAEKLKYYVELVYEFAFDAELPITLVFWTILLRIVLEMEGVTVQIIALNANLHAGPLICLLIELPFNSCRFPIRHFYVVMIGGVVYLLINMLYSVLVSPVYRPINWISVVSYLLCIGAIGLAFLMHLFGHEVYDKWKKQRLYNDKQSYYRMNDSRQIQFASNRTQISSSQKDEHEQFQNYIHRSQPQIKSDCQFDFNDK